MNSAVLAVVSVALLLGVGVAIRADAGEADALGLLPAIVEPDERPGRLGPPGRDFSPEVLAHARAATVRIAGRNCAGVLTGSGVHVDGQLLSSHHLVVDAFDAKVGNSDGPVFSPVLRRNAGLDLVLLGSVGGTPTSLAGSDAARGDRVLLAGYSDGNQVQTRETSVLMVTDGAAYGSSSEVLLLEGLVPEGFSGGPVFSQNGELLGVIRGYEDALDLTVALPASVIREWMDSHDATARHATARDATENPSGEC